ncbi:hypothetical protein AALP_AA6G002100 [Arabis alpina]|uniref:Uncharacterized protein n=1 Tax=Arabis alpina TaxID=50452 RepID=A0A087GL44_ARAAL|nr:hypothetical protein AALP_AA6G002100 [Arabis alpina]
MKKRKRTTTKKKPSLKKKKNEPSPSQTPNPSLSDDLLVSCFARVSKLYYPTLSLVSKSFGSLLASPELYKTRSLLNRTESCLYVCLQFPTDPNPLWFTLCLKPTLTKNNTRKKKSSSSGYVLAALPIPHSPSAQWLVQVAVGSSIYNIGGLINILDCQSHTWHEGPRMQTLRNFPAATVVDGKIYVAGGCREEDCIPSKWMEVFDPNTQTWEFVLGPFADHCERWIEKSAVIDGEIYMFGHKSVAYKPKEEKWQVIQGLTSLEFGWAKASYCVVDNILYCYNNLHGIKCYDSKLGHWIRLVGLKGLPKFAKYSCVQLAEYGGKLVVLWDKYLPCSGYQDKKIWCAVINLERRSIKEMWGEVEWLDAVLTVPKYYKFVCALSPTF